MASVSVATKVSGKLVADSKRSLNTVNIEHLVKKNGVKHMTRSRRHPAINGHAENLVFEIMEALAKCSIPLFC